MPKFKLFFKIFILFFPVMVLTGILMDQLLFEGNKDYLEHFTRSILTSIVYASIFFLWHLWELKKAGFKEFTDENLQVKQERIVDSNLNLDEVLDKLKQEQHFKHSEFNLLNNVIEFKTFTGNSIVKIERVLESKENYQYKISSKPKFKIPLLDFGTNYIHISKLQQLMK